MKIKVILPVRMPSPNVMLNWHWRIRHTFKKEVRAWLDASFWGILEKYQLKGKEKRQLVVTEFRHQKLDVDNLVGSVKYLLDQMQALKLIYDDRAEWLDLTVLQEVDRKNQRTEFILETINE